MKKLFNYILIMLLFTNSVGICNAWIINDEIKRRGYPEYDNKYYEYNSLRRVISEIEMNLYLLHISDSDSISDMKRTGYAMDRNNLISNIKILLQELKKYNYLIKR